MLQQDSSCQVVDSLVRKASSSLSLNKMKSYDLRDVIRSKRRGFLSIFGAFLIQLCAGCYHGTFGNILPYLTSYMRQVTEHLCDEPLIRSDSEQH